MKGFGARFTRPSESIRLSFFACARGYHLTDKESAGHYSMQRLPLYAEQIKRRAPEDEGDFGFDFRKGVQRLRMPIRAHHLLSSDDAVVSVVRASPPDIESRADGGVWDLFFGHSH